MGVEAFETTRWFPDRWRFGADWRALRDRLAEVLVTLDQQRAPVLSRVLCADEAVQTLGLAVLRDTRYFPARLWYVRLVDGVVPPERGPDGHLLPDELRGKVLRAKVGNVGGDLSQSHTRHENETMLYTATARQALLRNGRAYRTIDVPFAPPVACTLDDAVHILRRYGYGIATRRYWCRGTPQQQDRWLVEEVHPALVASTQSPTKEKR